MNRIVLLPLLLIMTAAACPREAQMTESQLPPARDGDIAIREELDAARRSATVEAYDLFLARHPSHPLVGIARRERARLLLRGK